MAWLREKDQPAVYEEDEDWTLNRSESLRIYMMADAFSWQVSPFSGGFTEWPDWFLQDLIKISRRKAQLKGTLVNTPGPSRKLG